MIGVSDIPDILVNVEAEAEVIATLFQENSWADTLAEIVTPQDFADPVLASVYEVTLREIALGNHATPVTLKPFFHDNPGLEELGGMQFLARLAGEVNLSSPIYHARSIVDLANRRRMRAGLHDSAISCADMTRPLADIVSDADAAIQTQAEKQASKPKTLGSAARALAAAMKLPDVGVTCPLIPSLDSLLGRLRAGRMYVMAGRPGMGKTSVAMNYARGAAQVGHGTAFFSLEMSAEDLAGKAIAEASFSGPEHCHVPHVGIERRNLTEVQRRGMDETIDFLDTLPLEIVDDGDMTISRIRARVRSIKRRMKAQGKSLDLVVVDYLQLVRPDRKTNSVVETVTEVSKGLKSIAMTEGVAVIALAQLSRSVEQRPDKRPIMPDLRESGQIEQDADAILFLLREEYYHRQSEPEEGSDERGAWESKLHRIAGVIEFILAKKRLGSTGTAFGRFYGPYQAVR
jgi:replicative DNA helicase